jgi:hypothetical protein
LVFWVPKEFDCLKTWNYQIDYFQLKLLLLEGRLQLSLDLLKFENSGQAIVELLN